MSESKEVGARLDLPTILRRLNPNVPAGLSEDGLPRVQRKSNALRQLRTHVSADPFAKVLLSGHIGVGKSTELLQLGREMAEERWVIRCSVAESLGVHNASTFALLVVLLEAALRSWFAELGPVPPGLSDELIGRLRAMVRSRESETAAVYRALIPSLASRPVHGWLKSLSVAKDGKNGLLGVYHDMLNGLALRSVSHDRAIGLDPSPIAYSCEIVLKELQSKAGRPVLLVVDDLDKVRNDEARDDIFLNRAMIWKRLPCGIVSTLPLDALFAKIGRELDQVWESPLVLDPLPVPEVGQPKPGALAPYCAMLRSIGGRRFFRTQQVTNLAIASCGLPRSFVSACATCVRYALDEGAANIKDYHVEFTVRDIRDRWRGRLSDSDYEALVAVLDSGGANVPKAIDLLREGILIRDGNAPPNMQFRLANWAEPLVVAYRERASRKRVAPP